MTARMASSLLIPEFQNGRRFEWQHMRLLSVRESLTRKSAALPNPSLDAKRRSP
jgi:hypothetical protein